MCSLYGEKFRKLYFKIRFRNKAFEIFIRKASTFVLEINFGKPNENNIADALFDVCKHWPTDQSHFQSEEAVQPSSSSSSSKTFLKWPK